MAEALVSTLFPEDSGAEIVGKIQGSELAGSTYEPLFPYWRTKPMPSTC